MRNFPGPDINKVNNKKTSQEEMNGAGNTHRPPVVTRGIRRRVEVGLDDPGNTMGSVLSAAQRPSTSPRSGDDATASSSQGFKAPMPMQKRRRVARTCEGCRQKGIKVGMQIPDKSLDIYEVRAGSPEAQKSPGRRQRNTDSGARVPRKRSESGRSTMERSPPKLRSPRQRRERQSPRRQSS